MKRKARVKKLKQGCGYYEFRNLLEGKEGYVDSDTENFHLSNIEDIEALSNTSLSNEFGLYFLNMKEVVEYID